MHLTFKLSVLACALFLVGCNECEVRVNITREPGSNARDVLDVENPLLQDTIPLDSIVILTSDKH
jgi:hypothetical protein